jgi:hypothetical protein
VQLEDALFRWVSTQATLTALIGAPPAVVRFHKGRIPQGGHFPAMVQQRTGTLRQDLQCRPDGAVAVSLQVDSYGKSFPESVAVADEFRRLLRADVASYPLWMGEGDSPSEAVKVKAATLENDFDIDDPEPGLYRRVQLWRFWIWQP